MTADVLAGRTAPRPVPVPVVLGLQEGLRLVRHPVAVVGLLLNVVLIFTEGDNGPRAAFEVVSIGPIFWYGVFVYFAANLVASRDRRARSGELLAALPRGGVDRVAALCLAALAPAAVCMLLVLGLDALLTAQGAYVEHPGVWHLLQAPLTVLGAALLGTMVARLTSIPGVALLVMIAMVLVNAWLNGKPETLQPLATFVPWARWPANGDERWVGFYPGSPAWHDAYLVGLCAMAACGAFLREHPRPLRVLLLGAVLTALTAVPAVLQLP